MGLFFWNKREKDDTPTVKLSPMRDPTSIGNLILKHKMLSVEVFEQLLDRYREVAQDRYLGQFLVEQGDIGLTQGQLDFLLLKQKTLRRKKRRKVDHTDVMRAIRIATQVQADYSESLDELARATDLAPGEVP